MEKNEHSIFADIPGSEKTGKYHSAVLTTYAIDLIHFDNQLINRLHRKQIYSVNVLADYNQLETSIDLASPLYLNKIGKDYSISGIKAVGAFHPKINFFVGEKSVLVVLGTGNLTVPGHGKNHEAFTGFMIDETNDNHRPLIEECWRYITRFTNQCGDYERNRILNDIPQNCSFLDPSYNIVPHQVHIVQEGLDAALLYNDSESGILQQISRIVPLNDVKKVTVISPYFDEDGGSLLNLSGLCSNAKISVLIQETCPLPPNISLQDERVTFYDFDSTKRGSTKYNIYNRQLHAKIIHFKTKEYEYCLIGSANTTKSGLGTLTNRGANEEFCVLYRSRKKHFIDLLGLNTNEKITVPQRNQNLSVKQDVKSNSIKYRLLSAEYDAGVLYVTCDSILPKEAELALDDGKSVSNITLQQVNGYKYEARTALAKKDSIACFISDSSHQRLSNKIFVNWPNILSTTNPSQLNRSLNRLISRIENEGYDGNEIVSLLTEVMSESMNEEGYKNHSLKRSSSDKKSEDESALPDLKYNPEYDNDEVATTKSIRINSASRLIECIEESIKRKNRSIEDALNDEEEEGNAEESNEREIEVQKNISIGKKQVKGYSALSNSLLKRYQEMITVRSKQMKSTGNYLITLEDLNFFSLSLFAAMELCLLNRPFYLFEGIDPSAKSLYQKDFYDSLDRSIFFDGLKTIQSFASFCSKMKETVTGDSNYDKAACRTMKYAVLYGALYEKYADQGVKTVYRKQVMNAVGCMALKFGIPSLSFLAEELSPISERYDFVFRISHIADFVEELNRSMQQNSWKKH